MRFTLDHHSATTTMACLTMLDHLPAASAGQLSLHHHSATSSPKLPVVFVWAGVAWRGVGTLAVALGVGGCLLRVICALFNS
jgi:hypothetical protein